MPGTSLVPSEGCPPTSTHQAWPLTNKSQLNFELDSFMSSMLRPTSSFLRISPEAHLNLVVSGNVLWGQVLRSLGQATRPPPASVFWSVGWGRSTAATADRVRE